MARDESGPRGLTLIVLYDQFIKRGLRRAMTTLLIQSAPTPAGLQWRISSHHQARARVFARVWRAHFMSLCALSTEVCTGLLSLSLFISSLFYRSLFVVRVRELLYKRCRGCLSGSASSRPCLFVSYILSLFTFEVFRSLAFCDKEYVLNNYNNPLYAL